MFVIIDPHGSRGQSGVCVCIKNESSLHLYVNVSRQHPSLVLLPVMNKASRWTAERQSEAGDLLMSFNKGEEPSWDPESPAGGEDEEDASIKMCSALAKVKKKNSLSTTPPVHVCSSI